MDDREIFALIHGAAKRNDPTINLSSSHRRLIQFEPGAKVPTLLNHWRFLQGELLYDINLGFSRAQLASLAETSGLDVRACTVSAIEKRTPNFSVLALSATKP